MDNEKVYILASWITLKLFNYVTITNNDTVTVKIKDAPTPPPLTSWKLENKIMRQQHS